MNERSRKTAASQKTVPALLLSLAALLFFCGGAFCAPRHHDMHGNWVIDLGATSLDSLQAYFGEQNEEAVLALASSFVITFDAQTMRLVVALQEKKHAVKIKRIEEGRGGLRMLWFQNVKFPEYIKALPDGSLEYGSEWVKPWTFILRREAPRHN